MSFSFKNYDCVGFDLDNTIVIYNVFNMSQLVYDNFVKFLVEQKGYATKCFASSLESGVELLQKGLTMDFHRGNIVKLGPNGEILKANHGTRQMTEKEISDVYGVDHVWDDGKMYCSDILEAWNGPLGAKIRSVLCYFDTATSYVFAQIVDTWDENGDARNYKEIFPDLLDALENMYRKEAFKENTGDFFPALKANPSKYINKCPEETIQLLKKLKEQGKFVYLMTGSSEDFASFTSTHALGTAWADLFDLVIYFARKPNFFLLDRPFLEIEDSIEGEPVKLSKETKFYSQGNWKELQKFVENQLGRSNLKFVYVGDSAVQDVISPVTQNCCDAISVTQELNASDEPILRESKIWGGYFSVNGRDTFWKHVIDKHTSLSVDSVSALVDHL